jgi:hypothetical protein
VVDGLPVGAALVEVVTEFDLAPGLATEVGLSSLHATIVRTTPTTADIDVRARMVRCIGHFLKRRAKVPKATISPTAADD